MKFKKGDQVEIIYSGKIIDAFSLVMDGEIKWVVEDEQDIGKIAIVEYASHGDYSLRGKTIYKCAWYRENQLKLVYRPKYK